MTVIFANSILFLTIVRNDYDQSIVSRNRIAKSKEHFKPFAFKIRCLETKQHGFLGKFNTCHVSHNYWRKSPQRNLSISPYREATEKQCNSEFKQKKTKWKTTTTETPRWCRGWRWLFFS